MQNNAEVKNIVVVIEWKIFHFEKNETQVLRNIIS